MVDGTVSARRLLLSEAVYLLHRAMCVLRGAMLHAAHGICSWSTSSAYQAAVFSLRATLRFQGLAVLEIDNCTFILDVWPEVRRVASRRNVEFADGESLLIRTSAASARWWWLLFQRVLNAFPPTVWDGAIVTTLRGLDHTDFSKCRNQIHYRDHWPCDDMYAAAPEINELVSSRTQSDIEALSDPDDPRFTMLLARSMTGFGLRLFQDIRSSSRALARDAQLLQWAVRQVDERPREYAFPGPEDLTAQALARV